MNNSYKDLFLRGETRVELVNISSDVAKSLLEDFKNRCPWKAKRYFEITDKLVKKQKIKEKYLNNTWVNINKYKINKNKENYGRIPLIFFRDEDYILFYEGKHRIIALSECENVNIDFLCILSWPQTFNEWENLFKQSVEKFGKNHYLHHEVTRKVVDDFYNKGKINYPMDVQWFLDYWEQKNKG